ncbi:hypothetical protein IWQ57_000248 [Coemansia nantahalensis]|uniref:Uncharacterized protein n=1 Tax=Coemansia nantahalensis TaxID=2789366 RepID=A0ACC1K8G6_9FUNG|nr:hypothetical protein IWQ57_000248 [Coemansia nantahalensis]
MEVDISPITLDTTKRLAQLYPSAAGFPSGADAPAPPLDEAAGPVLDGFFAADFLPVRGSGQQQQAKAADGQRQADGDGEAYGAKYVRFLGAFARDHGSSKAGADGAGGGSADDADSGTAGGYADEICGELGWRRAWEPRARERLLALAVLAQAHMERGPAPAAARLAAQLAEAFVRSRLRLALWRCVALHLAPGAPPAVSADDLEVAVELLFLFASWGRAARAARPLNELAVERVCLAVELFIRYAHQPVRRRSSHHQPTAAGANIGRLQRLRLGHKALLLLGATWALAVGDEAATLRRINGTGGGQQSARELQKTVLARDALRHISQAVDKHPLLAPDVQGDVQRLLPLVHPFDGHLTRATQLGRFGPIRAARGPSPPPPPLSPLPRAMGSPSTQMLLADMEAQREATPPRGPALPPLLAGGADGTCAGLLPEVNIWAARKPPRAAREAVAAYVGAVSATRSDREYAEWWRRLVAERGMPLSLTLSAPADRRASASDVAINYGAELGARRGPAPAYEFCGIVEPEDLPGLELVLDGRAAEIEWPAHTAAEPDGAAHAALYRALFPLLPALSRALVLTIANWAPAERELPVRQFLISVGPPQPSDVTCLGIVKYPRLPEPAPPAPDAAAAEPPPASPLLGSNVKRLARSQSRSSGSVSAAPAPADAALRGSVSMTDTPAADGSARGSTAHSAAAAVPAEIAARLMTQHAQWQAVGALLMHMLLALQANHVLQADYLAQLLMNENVIPAMFWWLGTANLDLCTALPPALRTHCFSAAFARAVPTSDAPGAAAPTASPSQPALCGLRDCLRALRRLTSHNGMRKGLLYKNKAPYFYGRLLRVRHAAVQQIAAELLRDIMPVASRRQKLAMLEVASQVYLRAPAGLSDAFWLADYALDPQVEMHRHVELLRVLHYYHHRALGLRLPRDPALFPSLVAHTVDAADSPTSPPPPASSSPHHRRHHHRHHRSAERRASWKRASVPAAEHSWLLWESDLEDTLNDVLATPIGAGSSG